MLLVNKISLFKKGFKVRLGLGVQNVPRIYHIDKLEVGYIASLWVASLRVTAQDPGLFFIQHFNSLIVI
jgi:hypothetical protein